MDNRFNRVILVIVALSRDEAAWSDATIQLRRLPDHLQGRHQTDPELIDHIRQFWITAPYYGTRNLTRSSQINPTNDRSQNNQARIVNDMLGNKSKGFYIECGAADGERASNSLLFEVYHQWSGVLIEANPLLFRDILYKNRRAYAVNACLGTSKYPHLANFTIDDIGGGISELLPPGQIQFRNSTSKPSYVLQCLPLYSILKAIGVTHVDYFSLDIEGAEVAVLETLPLKELVIDIITIEKRVMFDKVGTEKKIADCLHILSPYGYKMKNLEGLDILMTRLSDD